MTQIKIVHRSSGIYDVYDMATDKHLFSRNHPDNVFAELHRIYPLTLLFVDDHLFGGRDEDRLEPMPVSIYLSPSGYTERYYCPKCHKQQKMSKYGTWYCERCGQALIK